jgi:hypothetical protein
MELARSRFQGVLLFLLTILFLQLEVVVYILSLEIELRSRSYSLEGFQMTVFIKVQSLYMHHGLTVRILHFRYLQYLLGCSAF